MPLNLELLHLHLLRQGHDHPPPVLFLVCLRQWVS
jgi:hypothetical protein